MNVSDHCTFDSKASWYTTILCLCTDSEITFSVFLGCESEWRWLSQQVKYGETGVFILENMSDQHVKVIKIYFIHSYNYIPNEDLKICKKWNLSHLKIIFCWFHSLCEISHFCHSQEEVFTLLSCYIVYAGSHLPVLWDNLLIPSWRVK